ncbi:hypothetical protein AGDE_09203 [Angomonas deanei]|nr:hypothetical protein AGDE_09203 [Angomonas deanei]|eukprot:EPY31140.1 hypothetical protein AGDE_09203 [Angomonas deanei]
MVCDAFGSYTYNLVSGDLQTQYNLSQRDSTTITTCGSVVGYAVLPYAIVFDFLGPLPIAILSIFIFPLGALLIALCFQGVIVGNVVRLCVFYSFMNVGTTLYDLTISQTVLSHFPRNRGYVVAILKSMIGIGSSLTGSLYMGFFPDRSSFFYFLMVYAVICAVLCSIFMRLPKYTLTGYEEKYLKPEEKERRVARRAVYVKQNPPMLRFHVTLAILIFLIIYTVVTAALITYLNLHQPYRRAFAIVTTVGWSLFFFIGFPIWPTTPRRNRRNEELHVVERDEGKEAPSLIEERHSDENLHDDFVQNDDTIPTVPSDDYKEVILAHPYHPEEHEPKKVIETEVDFIAPQYQTSFWRNLLTPHLWCLFWIHFAVLGTEMMIMNNAAFIFEALSGKPIPDSLRTLLTVLNGTGTAVGRMAMSFFEVWTTTRKPEKRVPLTCALYFPSTTVLITIVLLLTLPQNVLPLSYVLSAIGNGFLGAITALLPRTLYARDHAKHYNFLFFATSCSAIAINRFLYGEWYTQQAEKHNEKVCYRRVCVQMPLFVCIGLSCTTFFTTTLLHLRYRSFCRKVMAERAALERESNELGVLPMGESSSDSSHDDENENKKMWNRLRFIFREKTPFFFFTYCR